MEKLAEGEIKELKVHPHWWIKRMTRVKYGEKFVTLVLCEMIDAIEDLGGAWSFCTLSGCPAKRLPRRVCVSASDEELYKKLIIDFTRERKIEHIDYIPGDTKLILKEALESEKG